MNADGCTNRFRCVQCGFPIDTLYIQYSPGNIRLMKCEYCKVVADEYIECEVMILIIDLILHKPPAYRHLFYNRFSKEAVNFQGLLWKSVLAFLLLDIYRMWALEMNENEWTLPATVVSFLLDFGKMSTRVVLENLIFLAVMIHGTGKLLSASARVFGWKEVLLIVIISSYFKIFLMAMMVWKFPSSVIFIIDMFVISSNYVALKAGQKLAFVFLELAIIYTHSSYNFFELVVNLKDLLSNVKPHIYLDAIESYGNKLLQFGLPPCIVGETNR